MHCVYCALCFVLCTLARCTRERGVGGTRWQGSLNVSQVASLCWVKDTETQVYTGMYWLWLNRTQFSLSCVMRYPVRRKELNVHQTRLGPDSAQGELALVKTKNERAKERMHLPSSSSSSSSSTSQKFTQLKVDGSACPSLPREKCRDSSRMLWRRILSCRQLTSSKHLRRRARQWIISVVAFVLFQWPQMFLDTLRLMVDSFHCLIYPRSVCTGARASR